MEERKLADIEGRDIEDGDTVVVMDYIPQLKEWLHTEGTILYTNNKCMLGERQLYLYDFIRIKQRKKDD